jgi:hypothetical protein
MQQEDVRTMLQITYQRRASFVGGLEGNFGFGLILLIGIWTLALTAWGDSSSQPNGVSKPMPYFFSAAAAISALVLVFWRSYIHYLDDQITNLYPELLEYEGMLNVPRWSGISGYLSWNVRGLRPMLHNRALTNHQRVMAIESCLQGRQRRIGRRGHGRFDVLVASVILVGGITIFYKTFEPNGIEPLVVWWLSALATAVSLICHLVAMCLFYPREP